MAPLRELPSLQDLALTSLKNTVVDMCKVWADRNSNDSQKTGAFNNLRVLLPELIPPTHVDHFVKICLLTLKDLDRHHFVGSGFKPGKDKEAVHYVLSALVTYGPTCINLDEWKNTPAWHVILQYSKEMSEIKEFSSKKTARSYSSFVLRDKISESVHLWSNLTVFILRYYCTDEIISLLSENCLKLQHLDVKGSKKVSDECVPQLINITQLKVLILTGTNISGLGISHFLTELQSLNLNNLKCDGIPLGDLRDFPREFSLPIQYLGLHSELSLRDLEALETFFPNLLELKIKFQAEVLSLMPLLSLGQLEKLSLTLASNLSDSSLNAIQAVGSIITSLHIQCDDRRTMSIAFEIIVTACPNIESLTVHQYVEFPENNLFSIPVEPAPFQKLKSICWKGFVQTSYLAQILTYAHNVEKIDFQLLYQDSDVITDQFSEIILVNPLSQLHSLGYFFKLAKRDVNSLGMTFIWKPKILGQLSLDTLKRLITSSPKLSCIKIPLDQFELEDLKSFIKERNYDIRLLSLLHDIQN